MRKNILILITVLTGFILWVHPAHAQQQLVFGSHPFAAPDVLAKMFTPLIQYLEKEIGAKITFRSAKDYESALNAIVQGEIDISYLGPSLYAVISEKYPDKIRLLATALNNGQPTFKGVIVAKSGSTVNSLADLKGKKFAFGDPESTLSCYMPANMLIQAGVFDSLEYKFLGSHDNVAKAVLNGYFDAGGLKPDVAQAYVTQGLKIIAESEPVYEHVIVANTKVNEETAKKIQAALINLKDTNILTAITKSTTGFVSSKPTDYDNLRQMMKSVDPKIKK